MNISCNHFPKFKTIELDLSAGHESNDKFDNVAMISLCQVCYSELLNALQAANQEAIYMYKSKLDASKTRTVSTYSKSKDADGNDINILIGGA